MKGLPNRRDKWKARVPKTPSLSHGTRLFLVHVLARHMASDGFVSRPRHELAAEAGVSPRQVARYISSAVANGWLVLVAGGYRTMTAEYQATFPEAQRVTHNVTLSEPVKGDMNVHPIGGTIASPYSAGKGDAMRHTTSREPTRPSGVESVRTSRPQADMQSKRVVAVLPLGCLSTRAAARARGRCHSTVRTRVCQPRRKVRS